MLFTETTTIHICKALKPQNNASIWLDKINSTCPKGISLQKIASQTLLKSPLLFCYVLICSFYHPVLCSSGSLDLFLQNLSLECLCSCHTFVKESVTIWKKKAHFNLLSLPHIMGPKQACVACVQPSLLLLLQWDYLRNVLCKALAKWQGGSRKRNSQPHLQVDNEWKPCFLVSYNQSGVGHYWQLVYGIPRHWEEHPIRRSTLTQGVEILPQHPKQGRLTFSFGAQKLNWTSGMGTLVSWKFIVFINRAFFIISWTFGSL